MTGTSKEMLPLITVAATDAGLSIAQVKVSCILHGLTLYELIM